MKTIMMMLRHKQPNIQFEAFHVFKVRRASQSALLQSSVSVVSHERT